MNQELKKKSTTLYIICGIIITLMVIGYIGIMNTKKTYSADSTVTCTIGGPKGDTCQQWRDKGYNCTMIGSSSQGEVYTCTSPRPIVPPDEDDDNENYCKERGYYVSAAECQDKEGECVPVQIGDFKCWKSNIPDLPIENPDLKCSKYGPEWISLTQCNNQKVAIEKNGGKASCTVNSNDASCYKLECDGDCCNPEPGPEPGPGPKPGPEPGPGPKPGPEPGPGPKPGPEPGPEPEIPSNPQTGSIAIFIVWIIAIGTLVYSIIYFKNSKFE